MEVPAKCIHQMFEEQAVRTPNATAVMCDGLPWTYKQLDERANCLAHYLRKQGVRPETRTGWKNKQQIKMLVGGEALPKDLADRLLATGGVLWNLYGPTEVTIWATVAQIQANAKSIFIGRPIANTQAYILDHSLRPVPIGSVGDLYLCGRGVARGYLNAPELTAKRFICSPFSTLPDNRLYQTGDLARYRFDGNLEHLGRKDQQVKFHGFRSQIDLSAFPQVKLQQRQTHDLASFDA
jgi:non-ribosomal peptide synthetase component F